MARPKRKRASTEPKSSKKRQKSAGAKATYNPEDLWEIKGIIDENKSKYLIDWKDNPVTGESYTPTWEPKAHANREAIADWERKKKESGAKTGPGQSTEPRSKSHVHIPVEQQTSSILKTETEIDDLVTYQTAQRTAVQRAEGYLTTDKRTHRPASSAKDSTYIPSQVEDSQDIQFTHSSREVEIQDSLEKSEAIYSSQPSSVIVLIVPRTDIHKSEYLEYPEGNVSERDADSSVPQLESTALKSPKPLRFQSHRGKSVLSRIGLKTVIPDSQPEPSPLTGITVLTGSSITGPSQSSGGDSQLHVRTQVPTSSPAKAEASPQNSTSIVTTVNNLSGFGAVTGSHTSNESVNTVRDSSGQRVTENALWKADSNNPTDSWLTASYPILTAPVASAPQEGSSTSNRSLHPDWEDIKHPRSGERSLASSASGNAPSTEPSRSAFSVPAPRNPSNQAHSNSNSGPQEETSAPGTQKSTETTDQQSTKVQSTLGDNSVSDTSAAFQTQLPVVYSVGTTNNPTTENNSLDPSVVQQAAQFDPLAVFKPVSQVTSSQEQVRESQQSPAADTTTLHPAVEASLPAATTPEPSSVEKRRPSLNLSVGNTSEFIILQSVEVDAATDQLHPEHQHLSLSSIPSPPSFSPTERGATASRSQRAVGKARMSESLDPPTNQGGASLKERLRIMRASFATARMTSSRSPSVIPSHSPTLASESVNKPGSGPVQGLIERKPANRTGLEQPVSVAGLSQGDISKLITRPSLGQSEFIVALPMADEIRHQYEQVIYNNKEDIELFIQAEKPDAKMREKMIKLAEMIEHVENLSIHADLAKSMSPEPINASRETDVRWAQFCSAKFSFLGHLLDAMRKMPTHIAILAEPGPLLDLLEKFLRSMKIKFHRPDNRAQSPVRLETMSNVTLLPTGQKGAQYIVSRATAVIVMDSSFNPNDAHVRSFRTHLVKIGHLGPAIHLVIANSAEHVDRCIAKNIDPTLRLKLLIGCMTQARHEAGKLPAGYPTPAEAAKAVARFLLKGVRILDEDLYDDDKPANNEADDDAPAEWPLPPLGEVAGISELMESQVSGGSVVSTQSREGSIQVDEDPQSQKRSLEAPADEDVEPSKRQRLSPAPAEIVQPVNLEVTNEAMSVEQAVPVEAGNSETETETLTQLHGKLEEQKQIEGELRQTVSRLEEVLREYGEALNEAREEVEQQVRDSRAMRKERDAIAATASQSEERRKAQSEEITKLKEDRRRLEDEVRQAREALLSSEVPEKVEWARLQEANQQAQEEIARLQKKLEMTQQDFEFTRAEYQTASTAAVEARSEVETLRQRNEELEREAGVERVKLREALEKQEGDEDAKTAEIGMLKRKLEEQEQTLRGMLGAVRLE